MEFVMKSLVCRPFVCQASGQIKLHENEKAAHRWDWKGWKGCGERQIDQGGTIVPNREGGRVMQR